MSSFKPEEQLVQELTCPICLQLFSDPVALPCGHNYCRDCISKTCWTAAKRGKSAQHCPECREEYQGTDSLQKNFKLCSIIESYQAGAQQLNVWSKPQQVMSLFGDHCTDEESQAAKNCLKCEASMCSTHHQRHHEREVFTAHTLVNPPYELGVKGCAVHGHVFEYFCFTDMSLLCTTCFIEGLHQKHDVVTFRVAEVEMRQALESRSKAVSCRLQMTESLLKRTAEEHGACEATEDKVVNKALELMHRMSALVDRYKERLHVLMEEERSQRTKSWQLRLKALEEQQQQLSDAQQSAMKAFCEEDPCLFIHRFMLIEHKLSEAATCTIWSQVPSEAPVNTKWLQSNLKTQDFHSEMSSLLESFNVFLNPLDLTFNLCTAHPSLKISNNLHTVKFSSTKQPFVEHTERFTSAPQVMCTQGISGGKHVWVVEVGPKSMWSIGLCYNSIPRHGDHSRLGHNLVSWRLQWKNGKLTVCQASCNVILGGITAPPQKIEVALDCERGTLKFHSTKGHREHLHTFKTMFKEPVYPAFSIHSTTPDSWITLQTDM
ncbi:E3 ubiquitin-protein ligase Midline-1-like [Thalassophryne amazonica]|uniref:E3 ubiquitin-protein ligase Midline-1-like n=1 Tax=Thalassophryne amazonica TaxID=390379 RepID=UPI00147175F9|nr:E3 ubiquitin-protein ligase Midline-1-like [Thalassophryne amazonica]